MEAGVLIEGLLERMWCWKRMEAGVLIEGLLERMWCWKRMEAGVCWSLKHVVHGIIACTRVSLVTSL